LTETGEKNEEFKAVRAALGVDDALPILCDGHPVVAAVIAAGGSLASIYVPENTKQTSAIADLSNPIFNHFHELICKYLSPLFLSCSLCSLPKSIAAVLLEAGT